MLTFRTRLIIFYLDSARSSCLSKDLCTLGHKWLSFSQPATMTKTRYGSVKGIRARYFFAKQTSLHERKCWLSFSTIMVHWWLILLRGVKATCNCYMKTDFPKFVAATSDRKPRTVLTARSPSMIIPGCWYLWVSCLLRLYCVRTSALLAGSNCVCDFRLLPSTKSQLAKPLLHETTVPSTCGKGDFEGHSHFWLPYSFLRTE